jgi:malate synthase
MSASIFDFAVYFFHNYKSRLENGYGGVWYYLPKMEAY